MKKLLVILLLLVSTFSFAQTAGASKAPSADQALAESNKLLQQALDKINELEKENAQLTTDNKILKAENTSLKATNLDLQTSLAEASNAIKQSNEVLSLAYDRIDKDQNEIIKLRTSIGDLIKSGVEVVSYQWEIGIGVGYPYTAKLNLSWNPPWFPSMGFTAGVEYYFDTEKAGVFAGVKINLK
jgi:hypothetical protein